MTIYQIHRKLKRREADHDHVDDASMPEIQARGVWYPVKFGIENMKTAVHVLRDYAFNNPENIYRIIEVHYTTRGST